MVIEFEKIKEIIGNLIGDADDVTEDTKLSEIFFDEIDWIEFIIAIEEGHTGGFEISNETLDKITEESITISQAIDIMNKQEKTNIEIKARLKEIESDERLHYPPADVQINAPLALIRVDLKAERRILRWILGLD